jgi:transposase InsO family protein
VPHDTNDLTVRPQAGSTDPDRQAVALFRYGVIADILHLPLHHRGLYKLLHEKAEREYNIPGSLRRRVAAETIRGWLRAYRHDGFDALLPRQRADIGSTRSIPSHVVDLLCQHKDDDPALTIPLLIRRVREKHRDVVSDEILLAESTVHRLLARRGLMRKSKDTPTSKDHRRFEYESAGELWMSDVMYGPKLREPSGRLRQTYLIALLDDATRLVPFAAFALSEGTIAYLKVLEQAVRRRGIPKRLYVDNGSAFRSRQLGVVCAKLGIALIHARPYTPQGKGKMERWFRTVRMQCLPLMAASPLTSITTMNQALAAWIEGEYHHAPHRGLHNETPADKWARSSQHVRMPESNVSDLFLSEQRRRVQKDRTITLDGVAFEVDAALVGDYVMLRYDPGKAPDKRSVEVWHQGQRIEIAKRVDVLANCFVKRHKNTRELQLPAATADDGCEGLSLRELVDPSYDLDKKGLY